MAKPKRPPSMREKKRYVTFRILSRKPIVYSEMKGSILNSVLGWMGEGGLSVANMRIIRNLWDEKAQQGWISCSHRSVDNVKISLALIHQIGDEKVIFQVLRVSGTIKSGKEKLGN